MCELTGQLAACKVCTEENKRLRALAGMMATELSKWGWGDFHYGPQPQEQSVVAVLDEYRRVLQIDGVGGGL